LCWHLTAASAPLCGLAPSIFVTYYRSKLPSFFSLPHLRLKEEEKNPQVGDEIQQVN
jgi:hypothetical protein